MLRRCLLRARPVRLSLASPLAARPLARSVGQPLLASTASSPAWTIGARRPASTTSSATATTVDAEEASKFTGLDWDGPEGAALQHMHASRMGAIREYLDSRQVDVAGLRVLDVGCGGGLVSQTLLEWGAKVTCVDAVAENVHGTERRLLARAEALGVDAATHVDARHCTAEELLRVEGPASFDVVVSLEVVEHTSDPRLFMRSLAALTADTLVLSTINRTLQSYALAIVAAEHVAKLVPAGTHDWAKFVRPDEVEDVVHAQGMHTDAIVGLVYNPVCSSWHVSQDATSVNYVYFASR